MTTSSETNASTPSLPKRRNNKWIVFFTFCPNDTAFIAQRWLLVQIRCIYEDQLTKVWLSTTMTEWSTPFSGQFMGIDQTHSSEVVVLFQSGASRHHFWPALWTVETSGFKLKLKNKCILLCAVICKVTFLFHSQNFINY